MMVTMWWSEYVDSSNEVDCIESYFVYAALMATESHEIQNHEFEDNNWMASNRDYKDRHKRYKPQTNFRKTNVVVRTPRLAPC